MKKVRQFLTIQLAELGKGHYFGAIGCFLFIITYIFCINRMISLFVQQCLILQVGEWVYVCM